VSSASTASWPSSRRDRTELRKVIDRLQPGDVLVVTRLDRLARSTRDLLNVLDSVKQAGAGFRSLKDTGRRRTASSC
jgi:DNA invertase Pin-like site-specific DNA recombinase